MPTPPASAPAPTSASRRRFLIEAGKTLAASPALRMLAPAAGAALAQVAHVARGAPLPAWAPQPAGATLVAPPELRSRNGLLDTTLRAAAGEVALGADHFSGFLYDGAYVPPVLRVRPGDLMRIRFENRLPKDPSNLHFHGLAVSPKGHGDNVFVHVAPGESFQYEIRLPAHGRTGPGLFWYHPHAHGVVTDQILGGMSGGLVVDGMDTVFPMLGAMPETLLLIKEADVGDREVISINGQINPVVPMQAGEPQFWRLAHIGATAFLKLAIPGVTLRVVATDGHAVSRPYTVEELFISPGQRFDVIAIGPRAGRYTMSSVPFQNEAWLGLTPARAILTVASTGRGEPTPALAHTLRSQRVQGPRWLDEIRRARIARHRRLDFSRSADRTMFMIDARMMDDARVDQTVRLGDTEAWTIVNTDQQYHSFHIHQTAFLVTHVNGVPQTFDSLHDTFPIPPATDLGPSSLTVVIPFTDPVIVGRFVYHCHAVDHEDLGMMGIVEVVG